jgi:hypothetical protein
MREPVRDKLGRMGKEEIITTQIQMRKHVQMDVLLLFLRLRPVKRSNGEIPPFMISFRKSWGILYFSRFFSLYLYNFYVFLIETRPI